MSEDGKWVRAALKRALTVLESKEDELGRLDAAAGDGDHGAGMVRGLTAAVEAAVSDEPGEALMQAGTAFADAAGGASGAIYGVLLVALGKRLAASGRADPQQFVQGLRDAIEAIQQLGKAQPGDKTLLDALVPFVEALAEGVRAGQDLRSAWRQALPVAEEAAQATAGLVARKGRSSRLGARGLGHPDPGAVSLTYILRAVEPALPA